jgi:MYXO-CTERM domain-containing protein
MKRIACAALLVMAALFLTASASQGATFAYSFTTNTGYTGAGEFSYDAATAPAVIIESGSGQTTSLRSLSLAIFSPSSTLLDSGSAVIDSVSSSPYLGFEYDTATLALSLLDNNTTASGNDVSYFVSNYVDPANVPVTPGSTTFNLFSSTRSTNTAVFLGSAAQIVVTPVPEPATTTVAGMALLAIGGLLRLRRPASSAG